MSIWRDNKQTNKQIQINNQLKLSCLCVHPAALNQQCLELLGMLSAHEKNEFQGTQPPTNQAREGSVLEVGQRISFCLVVLYVNFTSTFSLSQIGSHYYCPINCVFSIRSVSVSGKVGMCCILYFLCVLPSLLCLGPASVPPVWASPAHAPGVLLPAANRSCSLNKRFVILVFPKSLYYNVPVFLQI